jgi:glycosyltransferase involved in cell wall biosynthesis
VKLGIYAIAKNEEANLPGWYERVREADSVVVVDTGSTDNTFHAARDLGIDVTRLSSEFFRFDVARNAAMERSPADCDYLISQDLDERLEVGWRAKLEASLAENGDTDLATATLHHDGMSYAKSRIHSRKNWTWRRPVHEDLSWTGGHDCRLLMTDVHFEHLPDVAKPRSALYVNLMRIGVHEDPDDAQLSFWLGRELVWLQLKAEAERELERFLAMPHAWTVEKAKACELLSWIAPNGSAGWARLLKGTQYAPWRREPWYPLAQYYQRIGQTARMRAAVDKLLAIPGPPPSDYLVNLKVWDDDVIKKEFLDA